MAVVDSLLEQVRQAVAERKPIYPLGGGTQQHRLADISEPSITISTLSLNCVIDYPHEDMTITVEAGMTIAELQKTLAKHGQTLPIDVPEPETATVGGSLAANISGPRRLGHGTWRDYVLGITWIDDQGQLAKAGGRVVKNVAGYDFCKLFCGSLGTLGIVTQMTLKVKPIAEKRATVLAEVDDLTGMAEKIRRIPVKPMAVFITGGLSQRNTLHFTFEDSLAAVDWSIDQVQSSFSQPFSVSEPMAFDPSQVDVHAVMVFSRSKADIVYHDARQELANCGNWLMNPLLGTLEMGIPTSQGQEQVATLIQRLHHIAHQYEGYVQLHRLPPAWRTSLQPWGKPRPDWNLMREVKRALDPHDLFQRNRHEILRSDK